MSKPRISAYARAVVTVEVVGLGSWGPECTAEQVFKQASVSAISRIENAKDLRNVRVIGKPQITMICTQEERP